MGYRGKVAEQNRARDLRAEGYTIPEIADMVGVSKSSVSMWVRDVPYVLRRPAYGHRSHRGPNALARRKADEIEALLDAGRDRIGELTEREFLVTGTALYAGEGGKGSLKFANSDPRMIRFFCDWLRHFFDIDEARLRLRLYLHEGLDLQAANRFWAELTGIPEAQFHMPYRAAPDSSIRQAKHLMGCPSVVYSCTRTHRAVMGLVTALLTSDARSGVAQSAVQAAVNRKVVGSSPTPGAPTH